MEERFLIDYYYFENSVVTGVLTQQNLIHKTLQSTKNTVYRITSIYDFNTYELPIFAERYCIIHTYAGEIYLNFVIFQYKIACVL